MFSAGGKGGGWGGTQAASGIHNTSKQRLWIAMRQPEGSLLGENPLIPLLGGAGRFRLKYNKKGAEQYVGVFERNPCRRHGGRGDDVPVAD